MTRAKFISVNKFRPKNQCLQEFLNGLSVGHLVEIRAGELTKRLNLFRGRESFQNELKTLIVQSQQLILCRRSRFLQGLLKLGGPLPNALFDDGRVAILGLPLGEDGCRNDVPFFFRRLSVVKRFVFFRVTMLFDHSFPFHHVILKEGDAGLNLPWIVAKVEPLLFTLFNQSGVRISRQLMFLHRSKNQ